MRPTKMRKMTIPMRGGGEDRDTSIRWWYLRRGRREIRLEEGRSLVTSRGGYELGGCGDRAGCTLEPAKGAVGRN